MSPDEALSKIARQQHGLVTTRQALSCGLTPDALRHRTETGALNRLHRGLFVVGGALKTFERDVLEGVLRVGPGAAGSHVTAAMVLGIAERRQHKIHVTAVERHRSQEGLFIHQAELRKSDLRTIDCIPVTAPNRTLVDIANERVLEAALDDAIQLRLTTVQTLRRYIADRGLAHNRGMAQLKRLLDDRQHGSTQKALERLFLRKLRAAGFPEPRKQHPVANYKIDFAYPTKRLAIELDGLGSHFSAAHFREDLRRQNDLVLAGWLPLRFSWEDVAELWPNTEARLRDALDG